MPLVVVVFWGGAGGGFNPLAQENLNRKYEANFSDTLHRESGSSRTFIYKRSNAGLKASTTSSYW